MIAPTRRTPAYAALAAVLALVTLGALWITRPRTDALTGVWAAPAVDGQVLAGRALVDRANTAVDLGTGKTIRLGSVPEGRQFLGAGRLVVVGQGRVDTVTLNATSRWTWRPRTPAAVASIEAVAAAGSWTVLRTCPTDGLCSYLGVDGLGRQGWTVTVPGQTTRSPVVVGEHGALPLVAVTTPVDAASGVFLLDPRTGRTTVSPAREVLARVDGLAVTRYASGGQCVTTTFSALEGSVVLLAAGDCPGAGTGWPPAPAPALRASTHRIDSGRNPFVWGTRHEVVVRRLGGGPPVARLVSREPLSVLQVSDQGMVVHEGDRVVRYAVAGS